jgi:two-component sensor histidine kinase
MRAAADIDCYRTVFHKQQGKAMQIASNGTWDSKSEYGLARFGDAGAVDASELLLLREITHRINNELTSTISFISLTVARSDNRDVKAALTGVMEHLYDHARIYRALQMPTADRWIDATAYLRELCQAISRAKLQHNGIELLLVEHPIRLSSMQSWRLGMIVSEFITNSCRHAFTEKGGTIRIELRKRGPYAECRVTDDGSSLKIVRSGHGLKIVQQLALALNGDIDLRFGEDGAIGLMSFPIANPIQGSQRIAAEM